ncbi:hypothetical protein FRC01_010181, partial [Tulasnella sp. 417]
MAADTPVPPTPESWNRWEAYAPRVRTLSFVTFEISLKTFEFVVQCRPHGKRLLFPNLRKLDYNTLSRPSRDSLPPFLAILGESTVEVHLHGLCHEAAPDFLGYLPQKVPHVQHISITARSLPDASCRALASSLIQLKKLTSLKIRGIALNPDVWSAMSHHPSLEHVSATPWIPISDTWKTSKYQPAAFVKLSKLVLTARFAFLCDLFQGQNELPTITDIHFWGTSVTQGDGDFGRLCQLLARKLPNLRCAYLGCYPERSEDHVALGLKDFRSLMECRNLQRFQLDHPWGVSVTASEIGELLDAWPGLDDLGLQYKSYCHRASSLNGTVRWVPPTLPLDVLLDTVIAKAPKMKKLGLVFDANTPISSTPGTSQQQFECLEELEVTLSTVVGQPRA